MVLFHSCLLNFRGGTLGTSPVRSPPKTLRLITRLDSSPSMASPKAHPTRDPTRYDYSSSTGSPERNMQDELENDFFQQSANDSSTSIVDDSKDTEDEELKQFEDMAVSRTAYLPPELLFAIFGRLTSPQDLQSCVFVCKSWARCAVELLWIRPYISKFKSLESLAKTIQMERPSFPYASLIKRLNLTTLVETLNDGTVLALSACNRLERLTLTNCSHVTDTSIMPVLENNPRLLALDLSGLVDVTDLSMAVISKNCKKLQGLNITNCKKTTDASMVAVAANCTHLKRLKLNECDQITNETIMAFTKYCPNLLELDLHKVNKITNQAVLDIFWKLSHLRELRLGHCELLTDAAFTGIPPRPYESLRILDLTNCDKLTDDSVEHIVEMAPRLRNLVLAKCRLITDRAVEFNEHQRAVFCVFSGPGVIKLRNHLNHLSHTTGTLAPDQAYYDDREEQETGLVDEEDEEDEEEEIQEE
ncbi:hypothetical protein Dda_6458 [Drechslerella dactyloides]|uniref:F-box domain-containing protein n=1 Tax=Drechslerella dactyloides TaxID=74499 RepID=A0AAD6ITU8_DREDA|nr:hypothetical protein Dda_6458 [Drechslerella dactyloides]